MEISTDIYLVQGSGRYFDLINHKKTQVRKRNFRRLKKKGLRGVSLTILKNCYPISTTVNLDNIDYQQIYIRYNALDTETNK